VALSPDATAMAANLYRALWAFLTSVIVIFAVSLFTKPKPVAELDGLVYGATILPKEDPVPFYKNVWLWAILAVCIFATLNILFW
jgi:SSS family solute:Na+ symporter